VSELSAGSHNGQGCKHVASLVVRMFICMSVRVCACVRLFQAKMLELFLVFIIFFYCHLRVLPFSVFNLIIKSQALFNA